MVQTAVKNIILIVFNENENYDVKINMSSATGNYISVVISVKIIAVGFFCLCPCHIAVLSVFTLTANIWDEDSFFLLFILHYSRDTVFQQLTG